MPHSGEPLASFENAAVASQTPVPVRIYALFHYLAEERPRVQRMFLDAGLLDLVVDDDRLTGLQRVRVPDEDTAARLLVAARLHDLAEPMLHRVSEPTRRELASARLLHLFVWINQSHSGHPRAGMSYEDSLACPGCGNGLARKIRGARFTPVIVG